MDLHVITYDHPHRKTQDLLYRLVLAGIKPSVLALDWVERKVHKPLFKTKLAAADIMPATICEKLELGFRKVGSVDDSFLPAENSVVLIAGAGILPEKFVTKNKVVNSHCGWLPLVKGLDALKWAIYNNQPIGVTTHVVDPQIDCGRLIDRRLVPLFPTDDLFSIAVRQYELEIEMLVESALNKGWESTSEFESDDSPAHRRMSHVKELQMVQRLEARLRDLDTE